MHYISVSVTYKVAGVDHADTFCTLVVGNSKRADDSRARYVAKFRASEIHGVDTRAVKITKITASRF